MENMKLSGLKNVLQAFDEHGWEGSFTRDYWRIANGANDLWFELYYKNQPVVQCISGELSSNFGLDNSEKEMVLSKILEVYEDLKAYQPQLSEHVQSAAVEAPESQPAAGTPETRRLNVTVFCQAVYNSGIDVPTSLSFEDALLYAQKHLHEIPRGSLDYIPFSDELDVENCDFEDLEIEERMGNVLAQVNKVSLDQQIQSASIRSSTDEPASESQTKEVAADTIQVVLSKDELAMIKESLDVLGDRLADRVGYSSGEKYWDLKEKLEGIESKSLNPPTLER